MGTAPKQMPKGAKGTVSVESVPGRGLRLRWRHAGKRYVLALGIPDSKVNQRVAQQKATQIELDMASGNFDGTLGKYRTQDQSYSPLSVLSLFEKFMNKKSCEALPRSLEKYRATLRYLCEHFGQQSATSLGEPEVERFYSWLRSHKISEIVFRERLTALP